MRNERVIPADKKTDLFVGWYYGPGLFGRDDHARLAKTLRGLKGKWILSDNDCPEIRALYEGWATIETLDVPIPLRVAMGRGERSC